MKMELVLVGEEDGLEFGLKSVVVQRRMVLVGVILVRVVDI